MAMTEGPATARSNESFSVPDKAAILPSTRTRPARSCYQPMTNRS